MVTDDKDKRLADVGTAPEETGNQRAQGAEGQEVEEKFDAIAAAAELEAALGEAEAPSGQAPSGDEYVRMLESDLESLSVLLDQKDVIARKAMERADRAMGEIDKSKERLKQDMERELERRVRGVLLAFVEVLDDLDRAIASAREMDHNPDVVAGVELVRKSFLDKLGGFGVAHRPALGEAFDPRFHDAVSSAAVASAEEHGKVTAVMREGYAIGEETLRPAMVIVGKHDK